MSALWAIVWGAFWGVETLVEVIAAHSSPPHITPPEPSAYVEVWP